MGVLGKRVARHSPWLVFSLWVILIALGMLEAWAILLHNRDYPTWKSLLYLVGIVFVGLCWLYGMFVSAQKQNCENKGKVFHQKKKAVWFNTIAVIVMMLSFIIPIIWAIYSLFAGEYN
jgi:magnesium-transporting ATPase (P-type)